MPHNDDTNAMPLPAEEWANMGALWGDRDRYQPPKVPRVPLPFQDAAEREKDACLRTLIILRDSQTSPPSVRLSAAQTILSLAAGPGKKS